jgi:hypothetical protein
MIFDFLLMSLFGYGLHQTRRVTETWPDGWRNNAEHTIGGIGMLMAWPHWYARLYDMPHGKRRGWLALAMSLLSVGAGVIFGWFLDK